MQQEEYFNIESGFFQHPKAGKLRRRHGADGLAALWALWAYAAKWFPNGVLNESTAEDICAFCGWSGDPGFVDDLVEIGFLDLQDEGIYSIHNWLKCQKHLAG